MVVLCPHSQATHRARRIFYQEAAYTLTEDMPSITPSAPLSPEYFTADAFRNCMFSHRFIIVMRFSFVRRFRSWHFFALADIFDTLSDIYFDWRAMIFGEYFSGHGRINIGAADMINAFILCLRFYGHRCPSRIATVIIIERVSLAGASKIMPRTTTFLAFSSEARFIITRHRPITLCRFSHFTSTFIAFPQMADAFITTMRAPAII